MKMQLQLVRALVPRARGQTPRLLAVAEDLRSLRRLVSIAGPSAAGRWARAPPRVRSDCRFILLGLSPLIASCQFADCRVDCSHRNVS